MGIYGREVSLVLSNLANSGQIDKRLYRDDHFHISYEGIEVFDISFNGELMRLRGARYTCYVTHLIIEIHVMV